MYFFLKRRKHWGILFFLKVLFLLSSVVAVEGSDTRMFNSSVWAGYIVVEGYCFMCAFGYLIVLLFGLLNMHQSSLNDRWRLWVLVL